MMRPRTITCGLLTLALALAAAAPSSAQPSDLEAMGRMGGVTNLGALFKEALSGRVPEGVTVEKLDGGLIKVAVPLREDSPVFRQKRAKALLNCAITIDILEPTFAGQLVTFDVAPLLFTEYYFGWVTINTTNRDITATSSLKTKGPGADINTGNIDITYDANAFVLAVLIDPGFEGGFHSIDVKVKGAKPGKLKGNFCVDCA